MGIKDPGARLQLCLRNAKTPGRIFWKNFRLETVKRIARSMLSYKKELDTVEGSTPSET
jgi:hypothetical protein